MKNILAFFLLLLTFSTQPLLGQDADQEDLSKAIQNPIASLISLPFQNNTDFGYLGDKTLNTLNIQPVIPIGFEKFNLITRTIIPIKTVPTVSDGTTNGLGDISLSLFFTPSKASKVTWGVGPALGLPTASDTNLGSGKWSAGPSAIALIQPGNWTAGVLVQNTWSYAGSDTRSDVNLFYSQVFVTRNLNKGWYVNSAPIITANWEATDENQWTVPLGAGVGRLFKIGNRPINAQIGYYAFVAKPEGGADTQLRVQFNLLFPK